MNADTLFVGVRDGHQTAIFVVNKSRCVSLADHLAHLQQFQGIAWEWTEDTTAARLTAAALLAAATNKAGLAGQVAEDFWLDVVLQFEHGGWELPASAVTQYLELWVTCRARQWSKPEQCYGCGHH